MLTCQIAALRGYITYPFRGYPFTYRGYPFSFSVYMSLFFNYMHIISPAFSDFAGRKVAIIVGGVLYGVGGILQTAAFFLWLVFASSYTYDMIV